MTTKDIEDWIYGLRPDFPLYKDELEIAMPDCAMMKCPHGVPLNMHCAYCGFEDD